jgi:hypothetical protein
MCPLVQLSLMPRITLAVIAMRLRRIRRARTVRLKATTVMERGRRKWNVSSGLGWPINILPLELRKNVIATTTQINAAGKSVISCVWILLLYRQLGVFGFINRGRCFLVWVMLAVLFGSFLVLAKLLEIERLCQNLSKRNDVFVCLDVNSTSAVIFYKLALLSPLKYSGIQWNFERRTTLKPVNSSLFQNLSTGP